ncbi:MAG: B12-binding domain-containing radical SAM protein [Nanoarchaeota archaeon]|nr:radical SAM protein [Nanoarchaeota archaeon]MBU1631839.1 radical SAM protein [Nanoarchaeota archaeon]MBU1875997.1 radical SAM protein [Nanoarchaeota archaeon]
MKNVLLVYLPFCTPASPPYSITNLYSFLKNNSQHNIDVLDLNLEFHKLKFPKFQDYYRDINNWADYDKVTEDYRRLTAKIYSENNKKVISGERPEFFEIFLDKIKEKNPDIVAFSIVYSSQAFYAYSFIKEFARLSGVKCVLGGPAVNEKLIEVADVVFDKELDFLEYISSKKVNHDKLNLDYALDFSRYDLDEYFTPKPVIPLKTTSTCYYKKCTFCTHFKDVPYMEYSLDMIKNTIIDSKQKNFFLIDDMIPVKMLLKIAKTVKPLGIRWACQLKPMKEFNKIVLKKLRESGLIFVMWGVESGNNRILNLINKGTNKDDIEYVLENSHSVGIKNIVYVMFGFPTETRQELEETINFLKKNENHINLISSSIFGLQKNTFIYNYPEKFGIKKIIEKKRTVLEPSISYETSKGLSQQDANKMRNSYKKTIEKINKYPKSMNFFREHMFCMMKNKNLIKLNY